MAPVQPGVVFVAAAEVIVDPAETADVRGGDAAGTAGPGVVGVFGRSSPAFDEGGPPLADDPPLLPIGRAYQPVPLAEVRFRSAVEHFGGEGARFRQIGRASCRERVCQYV